MFTASNLAGEPPVGKRFFKQAHLKFHPENAPHGIVDPVAALTYDLPPGEPVGPQRLSAPLVLAPPKVGRDMTPVWVAGAGVGGLALLCSVVLGSAAVIRRRGARL